MKPFGHAMREIYLFDTRYTNKILLEVETLLSSMRIDDDIESSATGWVGKASLGIDNPKLAAELKEAHELLVDGINKLRNGGSHADAVAALGKAEDILHDVDDKSMWGGSSYYRCIYDGGDGSSYESGYYKSANKKVTGFEINNTLDAIEFIKEKAYSESDTLSR